MRITFSNQILFSKFFPWKRIKNKDLNRNTYLSKAPLESEGFLRTESKVKFNQRVFYQSVYAIFKRDY